VQDLFSVETDKIKLVGRLSDDRVKLFLYADLPKNTKSQKSGATEPAYQQHTVKREDLLEILRNHIKLDLVDYGVIDDVVAHLNQGEKVDKRRIAKGIAPGKGIDGKLLLLVKIFDGKAEMHADQNEAVDLKNIHLFDNITKGQKIARLYPPKPGTSGVDALGQPIEAESGREAAVILDETLAFTSSEDPDQNYQLIVSKTEGYVHRKDKRLSIHEELIINQDVDYHTGNINFVGRVRILGDVMPGFLVKAGKGIHISGSVRGASLITSDGDIAIEDTIFGERGSAIVSAGDLHLSMAQELTAEVKGSIFVKQELRDCTVKVLGTVRIPDGRILGGSIFSPCGVEAKEIGNETGVTTVIHICSDVETTPEYETIVSSIEQHKKAADLLKLHLGPFVNHPNRIEFLAPPNQKKIKALYQKLQEVDQGLEALYEKRDELLKNAKIGVVPRINFLSRMYPGTSILSGEEVYTVQEELTGPASLEYHKEEGKFEIRELKPLENKISSALQNNNTQNTEE
jgi:uncharacterized protein